MRLFLELPAFNSYINNWNVSSVTNINYMFYNATSFNQPLDNWNVGNVSLWNICLKMPHPLISP